MAAKEESIWCSRQWEILYGRFAALRRGDHFIDADVAIKDRKSTRLNSSHSQISYAVFCLKKNDRTRSSTASRVGRQSADCPTTRRPIFALRRLVRRKSGPRAEPACSTSRIAEIPNSRGL